MPRKKVHASRKAAGKPKKKKHAKPAARTAARRVKASPGGAQGAKSAAVEVIRFAHEFLDRVIESIPADQAMYQASESDNHLLWTVGHLASTYDWFLLLLTGRKGGISDEHHRLFGYQSRPVSDPAAYPPLAEVKERYRAAFRRFMAAAKALKPADLGKPPAAESHGFARTRHELLLRAAWHEGWHTGQLSSLRRALGLPPLM